VFKLTNGQVWQQARYAVGALKPDVRGKSIDSKTTWIGYLADRHDLDVLEAAGNGLRPERLGPGTREELTQR
jgi:hypothetical protein